MSNLVSQDKIEFYPIEHATFVIKTAEINIIVDPVGKKKDFIKFGIPDIILVTDYHGDHFNMELIDSLKSARTILIAPGNIIKSSGFGKELNNYEKVSISKIEIEAIPMYNLTKEKLKFHEKGRGNGYVLTINGERIYISGDTEDIPEMRNLKNIDYAFVCMNLPYTMTVEQAVSAVLDFKPKIVIPYHYRGKDGFSDIQEFKKQVSADKNIGVWLLKWYQ